MREDIDLRKSSSNMKEYFMQAMETAKVFYWILQELVSPVVLRQVKWMIVTVMVTIAINLVFPLAVRYIINGLMIRDFSALLFGFGFLASLILCERIASHFQEKIGYSVLRKAEGNVDQRVSEMFLAKSLGQHLQEISDLRPESVEKGREDAKAILEVLVYEGLAILANTAISFMLLCFICPVAGLMMGFLATCHLSVAMCLNRRVANEYTPIEKEWRIMRRYRRERHTLLERVKTSANEQYELETMNSMSQEVSNKDVRFWDWYRKFATLRGFLVKLGEFLVVAWGSWLVWRGQMDIGSLYPMLVWSAMVSGNMWRIAGMERRFGQRAPSIMVTKGALTIKPAIVSLPDAIKLQHGTPIEISAKDLAFTYCDGNEDYDDDESQSAVRVIRGVSFDIKPGQKVALIGLSGAGKTTIMRLLLRYFDPDQGRILVNGHDLCDIDLQSWQRLVGYISQHQQVFDGTIRENLLYGLDKEARLGVADSDLWQLMNLLQINFKERLTNGLDTLVGSRGIKLSGGQAQRLMIGAAAIKRPSFMIIDEATSHLDPLTECLVHEGLQHVLSANVGALVIAHRLSTIKSLCGKFVVLKEGAGLQDGETQVEAVATSFEELREISPTFRQLYQAEQRTRLL